MTGKDILIYIQTNSTSEIIAGTRSDGIESDADLIETANTASAEWKTYVAGLKSWSVNTHYLVLATDGLSDLLRVGQTYTLVIRYRDSSAGALTGTAILKSCHIDSDVGHIVQGTFSFIGSGELQAKETS